MKTTQRIGLGKIRSYLSQSDSAVFSVEVFLATGIFILRDLIPHDVVEGWCAAWRDFSATQVAGGGRRVNRFNPVAVDEEPPVALANIHRFPLLLDVIEQIFGPDIALYNQRFVIKDASSRGPVFLHHDFPYHVGWPNKLSAFVPLSVVDHRNGGMIFYPGTHQFGYLGDAGEINQSILDSTWPAISPSLKPADVVLMNSLTWHSSGPHVDGPDRILADIIYQPADDPSGISLLRGKWRTEIFIDRKGDKIFNRSRVTRLVELQRELDMCKSGANQSCS